MDTAVAPVFISYAHSGKGRGYIELCENAVNISGAPWVSWNDNRIQSGENWLAEIENALAIAPAAILLIDKSFLISHFVTRKEVPALFTKSAGLGAVVGGGAASARIPVIPILVESCDFRGTMPWLSSLQMEPETSLRASLDPDYEHIKGMLTLDQLDEFNKGAFRKALGKRLGRLADASRNRSISISGLTQDTVKRPLAETPHTGFARYLERGDDLSGDHVTLQLNLAHAAYSTYRIETRLVFRDGPDSHSECRRGLVNMKFERTDDFWDSKTTSLHPGDSLINATVAASPVGAKQDQTAAEWIESARNKARELRVPLQLQIGINEDAGELCEIPWESMPLLDGVCIAQAEEILFSRAILSSGTDAVECRTRAHKLLRVLAVYSDVGIDPTVGGDPSRQQEILTQMMASVTPIAPDQTGSTLLSSPKTDVLLDHLSVGSPYDVLYLACEGVEDGNDYYLRLAGRNLSRAELTEHFRRVPTPRLVILVAAHQLENTPGESCSMRALAQFAALFSRLGAGSVLTCQRTMEPGLWSDFLTACFSAISLHGHVPGAVAAARNSTAMEGQWWCPVLISRPKAARMWYRPGFVSNRNADGNWQSLLMSLRNGRFCPVIGPGIHPLLQTARLELAREMADAFDFPLTFSSRINLPAVTQYVRTMAPTTDVFIHDLEQRIRTHLISIAGVPEGIAGNPSLYKLAREIAMAILENEHDNPYNLLAKLPISLYLTTTLDPFLETALDLAKSNPPATRQTPIQNSLVFDFTQVDPDKSDARGEATLPVTNFCPSEPLIVQLYGSYRSLGAAVIAEDDYYQFLATFEKRIQDVKGPLVGKLGESDLIFLGFKWNSLEFRVLFRALQKYATKSDRSSSCHIAVQVDPDDDETIRPDKVLEYLRRYFAGETYLQDARLSIFWGSTEDFLTELAARA